MQHPLQRDARFIRDHLGQRVGFRQRQVHDPGHILDAHLGGHGAVGDDLRHLVAAVFLHDIVDHLLTTFIVEVGIDIGHGLPVGVQETFEQQPVLDRIDVRDADAIGHHTAGGRSATRSDEYAQLPAGLDEIGYDQKVAGESHRPDREQFEAQPFIDLRRDLAVSLLGALPGQVLQVGILRFEIRRHFEVGQEDVALQVQ